VKRGELYLVSNPSSRDPKRQRVFVVVSRQALIETRFQTVICTPVYSHHNELRSQVRVCIDEGLKHDSSIHCDELVSLMKSQLTHYVGELSPEKLKELRLALQVALGLDDEFTDEF
jgi:mRNA interferase MazF